MAVAPLSTWPGNGSISVIAPPCHRNAWVRSDFRSGGGAGMTDNLPEIVDVRRATTRTAERAEFRQHAVVQKNGIA